MNLVMKNMIVSGAALENWADFCKEVMVACIMAHI